MKTILITAYAINLLTARETALAGTSVMQIACHNSDRIVKEKQPPDIERYQLNILRAGDRFNKISFMYFD